jgi:hypothetical protein
MNTQNPLTAENPIDLHPSSQTVSYSVNVLNQMVNTGQLTPEGAAFLKIGPDPWHDNKITDFRGIPDSYGGTSVVYSIPQELDIAVPASFAAGINYNVRITSNPIASQMGMTPYTFVSNTGVYDPTRLTSTMWPIQVDFAPSGTDFAEFGDSNSTGLAIPSNFLQGPYKVAALGIEVVNTTSDLNRQGLVSAAKMNQNGYVGFTSALYADVAGVNWDAVTLFPVRSCPKNLAELVQLPSPCQDKAAEGCYSVVELLGMATHPPTAVPQWPVWTDNDFDSGIATSHPNWYGPSLANLAIGPLMKYAPAKNPGHVPQNSTVIMFTGLSNTSTLTLRVRWVLERYPNDTEPDIVNLATPTAPFDPVALEIYSKLMRKLPAMVKFSMNPEGEWWKSMLAGIADIASSGLMMMPHPLAKGAGAALGAARALLAPNIPVQLQARATKTTKVPAKRKPQNNPEIVFAVPKKKKKKAKKKAANATS